ncbi:hypothetical protein SAMN05660845_0848 [Flavobacterium swingsii]|uniref:Uncharacterized protein n=2 Tax=Flavobacterium swingsii TaxID=498292 RepID=A0A1I0WNG6_9FLAO|nr:hypothetical protein SAMN05660845_0848 [Flavobacterium swingsii]
MMDKKTRNLIKEYTSEKKESSDNLIPLFEKVLDIFVVTHYYDQDDDDKEYDTLFCNIHSNFTQGHNCVACNLNNSNRLIQNFLLQYKSFHDSQLTFTNFILLLYLQVEVCNEYFNIMSIPENYRLKYFQIFQEVKHWANFLKHPKGFMLVHHPNWTFEGRISKDSSKSKLKKSNPFLDSDFMKKYYSGDKNNNELYKTLIRKEDLYVEFPNPINLITKFTEAQKKFAEIISKNEIVREMLNDKTTLEEYFSQSEDEIIL